jgi:hypothetical protein
MFLHGDGARGKGVARRTVPLHGASDVPRARARCRCQCQRHRPEEVHLPPLLHRPSKDDGFPCRLGLRLVSALGLRIGMAWE